MNRPRRPSSPSLVLVLLLAGCGGGSGEPAAPPRSLLLVTIDTLRADRLGCYGYEGAITPAIDGLAERGVRFESAFSVAPLTFPAHVSLLTGTIPPRHGVRENGVHRAVPELVSLAEIVKDEGYATAAFTAAFVLDSQFGLNQGFDVYGDIPQRVISPDGLVEDRPASEVNAEAFDWLAGVSPDEPFFLWVHYFEPHLPYPPESERPAALRSRPYDAEVKTADDAVGALLARIKSLGRDDETLVVLTSDHGESLGEHGELTHSFFVYQSVLHVPLVFAHASLPRGEVVQDNASLVDVLPTVLELLGIAPPELPRPGRSLAGLFDGSEVPTAPMYFESMNPFLSYGWSPLSGVAIARKKLIRVPRPELYDLGADPKEATNLYASEPDTARALEKALSELVAANEEGAVGAEAERELSPEDRSRLAGLGYVGAAFPDDSEQTLADPKDGIERIRKEEEILKLFSEGRQAEAIGILKSLLDGDPENGVFNARYGYVLMIQGRFTDAIPYMERSIENGYRVADNLSNLGVCQLFAERIGDAQRTLESALEQNSKHLTSLFWLARVHAVKNERARAKELLERFLSLWQGGDDPMVGDARALLHELGG